MWFRDAAGLLACLQRIAADPAVQILRVKSGLQPGSPADQTAGFRVGPRACVVRPALGLHPIGA